MWMVIFRFLKALFPFVKESLFGKQPLPEIIYKHRVTSFFFFAWLVFFIITGIFIDILVTIANDRNQVQKKLDQALTEIQLLQSQTSSEQYEKTILRLEKEIDRLDREHERYQKKLEACEEYGQITLLPN